MPFQQSGSGGGAGLSILSDTLLGASAASFDIQNIAQTFTSLFLLIKLRDDGAVVHSNGNLRFNNDSTAGHYNEQFIQGNNVTATSTPGTGTAFSNIGEVGANASANSFGFTQIWVHSYTDAQFKSYAGTNGEVGTTGTVGTYFARAIGGIWLATSAINRVTLTPGNGSNFVAGSRLTIFGL